ncbi:hypothetical protein EK21DRAFT_66083 [Setomelanomma holmii]|uniref:SRR1-like domain-containing protein n=1 Tax=Setomelanomma holmii TaxID=210430 RepID=A0A9P4H8R4_9PLEO|nr:hypothetical protein EK21DRAFT_66083 [Setomelanomma holmii]
MSHALVDIGEPFRQSKTIPKTKAKSLTREARQLMMTLNALQDLCNQSKLSISISRQLETTLRHSKSPITHILSLGLGSLRVAQGQTRRLKQLTILLAIREQCTRLTGMAVEIYAQDPTFTRTDEIFLASLGISILRTPSSAQLGEAGELISSSTLVYSPFLTIEAYEKLFLHPGRLIPVVFGDDFNALASKWPKHSAERRQVESVMKSGLSKYRRRVISGAGFWLEEDETFPMALYEVVSNRDARVRAKM